MSNPRSAFLNHIRQALQAARLPLATLTNAALPPSLALEAAALAESFIRELVAVGGKAYRAETPARALELTLELINATGGKDVLAWADADLPVPGLNGALKNAGFNLLDFTLPGDPIARQAKLSLLEGATVGITGAWGGLADTGSLALPSGPTRPRLASLLPPVHIALLPLDYLYPTMAAFFAARPESVQAGSNLVFITGPSRTADIELTLTMGVHGPQVLHVVLVRQVSDQ